MREFLAAIFTVAVIAYGASVALESYQRSADAAFVGSGAKPSPDEKLHPHTPKS